MSDPRKWWIVYAKLSPRISVFDAKPNSMESIEVIEASAYDALKADRDNLRKTIESIANGNECCSCSCSCHIRAREALEQSKQSEVG